MASAALRVVEGASMDKTKALDAALSQIERAFGKGSIMRLGKNNNSMDVETVSTGSLGLDIALGIGGLPRGRVVEIYGPESSGKTTLALHCLAEAQKKGGTCAFIDAEHALQHHGDLHSHLIDEDHHGVGAVDRGRELAQRLAHQPRLQPGLAVAHL